MSTQRYVSTSFWNDKWIRSLDPSERYLYLYLITNPLTNIAGVYQITLDRIAFDTGYDERTLGPMLERFGVAGKAHFYGDEWIVIPSWPRHQQWEKRGQIRLGIEKILKDLPQNVLRFMVQVGYRYPIDTLLVRDEDGPGPYQYPPSYPDLDSDRDIDRDRDSIVAPRSAPPADPSPPVTPKQAPAPPPRDLSPMRDELANQIQAAFTHRTPAAAWKSIGQERKHLADLATRVRRLSEVTGAPPERLAADLLTEYDELRRTGRGDYWRGAPFIPSALVARWDSVVESLRQRSELEAAEVVF